MRAALLFFRTTMILSIFCAPSYSSAHHSPSNYDLSQTIEIDGTVTRVLWRNPHVRLWVLPNGADSEELQWEIQALAVVHLTRRGISRDLINVGDTVRVAGSPARRTRNEMVPHNILLPGNREFLLDADAEPRWSDNAIRGEREIEAASDASLGIFRVWLGRPGLSTGDLVLTDSARAVADDMATRPWDDVLTGCSPKGMPEIMAQPNPIEFSQQGDTIILRMEEYDTVRTISMQPTAAYQNLAPTLLGNSVGEWQGETLAVTTTGISYPWYRQIGIPQSQQSVVVERFTVNSDGSQLNLEMTITDPATFLEPVVATKSWTYRPGLEVLPYNCAEE